jgi:hypothetical protein
LPPSLVVLRLSLLNRTAEFVRLVRPSNAVSQMVSLASELRPDSSVVAEVRASPNHNERKNDMEPDTIVLQKDPLVGRLKLLQRDGPVTVAVITNSIRIIMPECREVCSPNP